MAENFISQLNTNEDLEKKSEMMKDFADIVQQSQELKVEIGKYCNMTFTEDEIDSIRKIFIIGLGGDNKLLPFYKIITLKLE